MLEVKQINDKKNWNNFLLNQPTQTGIFLQSAEWLDFQEAMGHKIYRLGLTDEQKNLATICGIIQNTLPLGKKYLYIPRGPIGDPKMIIDEVKKMAERESEIFLKVEPLAKICLPELLPTASVQPQQTLVLNLKKSEDELLSAMHEKTRYNIRLANKKNLSLKSGSLEDFWGLMKETTISDKFHSHPKKYYQTMLEKISSDGKRGMRAVLKIVYFENHPVAAAIIGYFGDTATYLHGASSYEYRNLMAPYFLHWNIIKEAKNLGYKFYDFWGIDEVKWPGVTRFKKGFASEASPDRSVESGYIINYPGTFDLPINKFWYTVYSLAKKIF
jgi:peptidoglycan pentaglycine glycine transferase (the first glycine)